MDNINGALAFKATLDINDFNVSAQAMERNIRNVSATAISESDKMDDSIQSFAQNGARYIVSYLVGQGMGTLLQSIVQTRGQFQQLEIAFSTMLRSNSQAKKLMDELIVTAAKTPFDLQGIASTTKQMLAYGSTVDNVVDELVMLGNVASGVGAPLGDIAYLYGTLRTQGRAFTVDIRQFAGRGIPIYEELAKVLGVTKDEVSGLVTEGKVGFAEVEKAFQNMTSSSGIYYNLMQEQSKSLTGMISNLGDAWDNVLNDFGKSNQDLFAGAIQGATYFVEHMDDVLRIVKAIVLGYGSLKAAIVLNTLVTKGYTGVSLIDNTVRQAKIALMRVESKMSGEIASITKKMEEAEKAHIKSLQEKITIKQHQQALDKVHIAAINDILTAEQKRYLSNLNLTSSSRDYLKEAESILTVEQKSILKNQDKTKKMQAYADTIAEMAKQNEAHIKSLKEEAKGLDERASQLAKSKAAVLEDVEAARYEVYWAKQGNDARKIGNAERRLSASTQRLDAINTEVNTIATRKNTIQKQLNTLESRKSAAVGLADVTAKTAQTTATNLLTIATGKLKFALSALWASMKANPIGWLVTAIGMAYSAYEAFFKKTEETLSGVKKATKSATDEFSKQAGQVDALRKIINDGNASYDLKNAKLKELKGIIPGYNAELTKEGEIINDNTKAIKEYLTNLEKQIKLKAAQEELEELYRQKRLKEKAKKANEKDVEEANKYLNAARFSASVNSQKLSTPGMKSLSTGMDMATKNAEDDLSRANKALAATNREIEDIENTINELNNEINAVSSSMNNSTANVKSYSEQVNDARKNVDLLKKELAELRSGKVEKENLAKAIEEKENDLKVAQRKLDTLTGYKNNKKNDALNEKQLEADRKLEADRIAVMEEGYEKRKALLDLQHKKALDDINKEEKALEKARKESGNGSLSRSEKDGFNERRNLENKSYNKAQNKLFDGELDYKKKQYELYFRWVRNMGEDVANKQFASLLKGGASYKEYVESQIQQLNMKKQNGTLSEGEGNHLISLNMQYDEITGAKSAMDSFKDSVTQSISQAQTLAEKLEALAKAKDKLANGESGLVGADEHAEANLIISEKEVELQKELQNTLMQKYHSFEQQKLDIQKEYKALREAAEKSGNQEMINRVNEAENEALSSLNAQMLMQTESWKKLFGDLDSLSVAEIEKLIADIEGKLDNANLKLNPVDYKAVIDSLNQAKQELISKNPFKALGTFFDDYIKAKQKLATAKANVLSGKGTDKDVQQAESEMKKAAKGVTKSIETITSVATDCGNSIASMFSDLGDEELASSLGTAMDLMGQLGNAAASVGKFMSGDVLGGITGMVSSITSVVGIFAKLHDAKYERRIQNLQKEIDALEQSYSRLERAYNNTYWVFNDSQREAYEKNIKLIKDQINALEQEAIVAKKNWDFREYARLNKEIKELNNQLKKAEESGDMYSIYKAQIANLEQQKKDVEKQILAEQDKKKTDNGKIQQWNEQIESITQQIEDLDKAMMETLAGTDVKTAIDEFADALVDAYCKGEDAAEALGQKTKDVLKKAVVEALKREFLAKGINDAVLYLGESMKDGKLSSTEKSKFESMVNAAGDLFNDALEGIGDWIKDVEDTKIQDPLAGAVTSMSEETGGVIAGRLNAFTINQSDQTAVMKRALEYQAQIAANTKISAERLGNIERSLKVIENRNDNSLLSQGIS